MAQPRITFQPRLSLGAVLPPAGSRPADDDRAEWLCSLGRDAVYWGLRGLGYPAGTPAWLPAYHCGVEVQAAVHAGLAVGFYRVREDCSVDVGDLASRLTARPGPVLIIHYFGTPQPETETIAALCRTHGVPLIEDCCHTPFASHRGRALGTFAPLAAYSFSKALGTVDGGSLRVDRSACREILGRPFVEPALGGRARWPLRVFIAKKLPGRLGTRLVSAGGASRDDGSAPPEYGGPDEYGNRPRDYTRRISRLSERAASRCDPGAIVRARRSNRERLCALLKGLPGVKAPPERELPDGAAPLGLPIAVDQRDRLVASLSREGIDTYVFGKYHHPAMDPKEHPEARELRDHVLCLPVHHQLRPRDLERIADVLWRLAS